MTRIDFYVLKDKQQTSREQFACQLAEKIYKSGHQLLIHTESQNTARKMDSLLWTFRDSGFIPHSVYDPAEKPIEPVVINFHNEVESHSDVMLNLATDVPPFFSRFQRVTEIVSNDDTLKAAARQRFKFYRDRGYQIVTHEL